MIKVLEIVMVNLGFTINNSKFIKFSQKNDRFLYVWKNGNIVEKTKGNRVMCIWVPYRGSFHEEKANEEILIFFKLTNIFF